MTTGLEQRVKSLEKEAPPRQPCNHPSIAYLTNSTEEELDKLRRELDACRNCKGSNVKIVIFQQFKQ